MERLHVITTHVLLCLPEQNERPDGAIYGMA